MITSIFKKSTPLNFSLVVILILSFFFIYQFQDNSWTSATISIFEKTGILIVLVGTVFLTNFISIKNGLSKDSGYTVFFCFLLLVFFPSIFNDGKVIIANFFVLLALRRLFSLQSLKASKEKIFDASLWIFVASLFHFWSILFLALVFISITFHVAKDYRNWILPVLAFICVAIAVLFFSLLFDFDVLPYLYSGVKIDFSIDYFTNSYQNAALSIYATVALFFIVSMLATLSNKPLVLHASYKKIIVAFFIGIAVFLVSADKSNDLLLFTIAPLSIMATSHIEMSQPSLKEEIVLGVLILCSLFLFFLQL
jgi:hypothetical protein